MNTNRRKHPRIPLDTEIRLRIGFKIYYPLRCDNISMGGMCIHMAEPVSKGKKGKLWVTHSIGRELIQFEAPFKILWVAQGGSDPMAGVEFFKMKRKHEDNLLRLLRLQGTISAS